MVDVVDPLNILLCRAIKKMNEGDKNAVEGLRFFMEHADKVEYEPIGLDDYGSETDELRAVVTIGNSSYYLEDYPGTRAEARAYKLREFLGKCIVYPIVWAMGAFVIWFLYHLCVDIVSLFR
jgi:hypothetical protein